MHLKSAFMVALAVLALAGCTSDPKSSLPTVQREVAARLGQEVAWPQSNAERSDSDRAVQSLLAVHLTSESPESAAHTTAGSGLRDDVERMEN